MKYFITYHAIDRLKERFQSFYNKHEELKSWNKTDGFNKIKCLFDEWIFKSEENKSHLNNSVYMIKLYDKYGYDTEYKFLEYLQENIVFVLAKNRSENHFRLVTLMPTEFRPSIKNTKYNDKIKKEDKHNKFIMDWYDNLNISKADIMKSEVKNIEKMPIVKQLIESTLSCSKELELELSKLVQCSGTNVIEKISHTKTIHQCVVDNVIYEFIYAKKKSGGNAIILQNISTFQEDIEKKNKKVNRIG
jgi:hypothetical protein